MVPGTTLTLPSVTATCRSAVGIVSVSLALLLAGSASVTPPGGLTVAVLVSEPEADGSTWTVKQKVTLASTGRSTVVARAPLPLVGAPLETLPPPVLPVTVQLPAVTPAGRGSETLAPVTALGPVLLTTMM